MFRIEIRAKIGRIPIAATQEMERKHGKTVFPLLFHRPQMPCDRRLHPDPEYCIIGEIAGYMFVKPAV